LAPPLQIRTGKTRKEKEKVGENRAERRFGERGALIKTGQK
jgi:hypothetical protein